MSDSTATEHALESTQLDITGMTCASCAARIERKLGKLPGVAASVNLATETARVSFPAELSINDLVCTVEQAGYGASLPQTSVSGTDHDQQRPALKPALRLLVATFLTVPVVVLAMWPGLDVPHNPWWQLALSTPVALWAAWPFHRAALTNARHRASTMDTLVSLGVLAAWSWSTFTLLTTGRDDAAMAMHSPHYWFETAAVITTFLLAGRWLEGRARARGAAAFEALLHLAAKDVEIVTATGSKRIPIEQLVVGQSFVIRPGEKVATDAVVLDGVSAIDAALVTGEPLPVEVAAGSKLIGGTINTHGLLTAQATSVGADTLLAHITDLVTAAQSGKAPAQRLADRISAVFVPIVLTLAALTFLGWWLTGHSGSAALTIAISVLVVACPCALGLATPTALVAGTGRGASQGILIKGPQVLEDSRRLTTMLLDKTGTLTRGNPSVQRIVTDGTITQREALTLAAAVDQGSEHPLAQAVLRQARSAGIDLPPALKFRALVGSGAQALVGEHTVSVGKANLFVKVCVPPASANSTAVLLGWDGLAHARIDITDTVRTESAEVVRALRELGIRPMLLTGDSRSAAAGVAQQVGIAEADVLADVTPQGKHEAVRKLQQQGAVVGMAGDGINDAAALAAADVGIAMGAGTDAAIEAADLVLVRGQLADLPAALGLSAATLRVIKQNLAWAFGYNAIALPLAISGQLDPMVSGAAMAASSVLVVGNSLRLRHA